MADGRFRLASDPGIEVTLRRTRQARRLSLRVSSLDGRVTLTIPRHASAAEAQRFAEERRDWIAAARGRLDLPVQVAPGLALPIEGRPVRLVAGSATRLTAEELEVPVSAPGRAAAGVLKTLARDRLAASADRYAALIGRSYSAMTLRDTRSRWGSCTAEGRLMFSWRLAMAPPDVLDYVAAHEIAHLVHMDHSAAFWGLVDEINPGWESRRDWLRTEGVALHRFRFAD